LRANLGIGRNSTGVVVGCSGDQAGAQFLQQIFCERFLLNSGGRVFRAIWNWQMIPSCSQVNEPHASALSEISHSELDQINAWILRASCGGLGALVAVTRPYE
jgi:hypothetical protein